MAIKRVLELRDARRKTLLHTVPLTDTTIEEAREELQECAQKYGWKLSDGYVTVTLREPNRDPERCYTLEYAFDVRPRDGQPPGYNGAK